MKRRNDDDAQTLDQLLASHKAPPADEMRASIELVAARLRAGSDDGWSGPVSITEHKPRAWFALAAWKHSESVVSSRVRGLVAVVAAVLLVAAVGTAIVWPRGTGDLYRVVDGLVQTGGTIRTNDTAAQLALVDGSRVEIRSQSELNVERADDGLRIRLSRGDIIVNAATQRNGHLYVQTKDMTVSVVGTVFMVNADGEGSRVAVIEGEVRVTRGAAETTLRPGDHIATSPALDIPPVREAIGWSRDAGPLLALLQQSAVESPAVQPPALAPQGPQGPAAPRETFELASIRLRAARAPGGRGGPGPDGQEPKCYGSVELDPRRLALTNMMLYRIITLAYGKNCYEYDRSELDLLSGGPRWVRADRYDIEATLPQGTPSYTREQFDPWTWSKPEPADAPRLQAMLQALLADRFKLVVRREMKEVPGFALSVARGGPRLTVWKEGELVTLGAVTGGPNQDGEWRTIVRGNKRSVSGLAVQLAGATGRPVVDRTGITGDFNYSIEFTPFPNSMTVPRGVPVVAGPTLFTALEDMGLHLEPAGVPVEFLVIERVERPSDN